MNFMYGYTKRIILQPNERKSDDLYILTDSDFILEKIIAKYDHSFKIQVIDTTLNSYWFSNLVRSELIFGTSEYPNRLTYPIELKRATILKFDVQNLSNSVNNIDLYFEGYRIFEPIKLSNKRYFAYPFSCNINGNNMNSYTILIENSYDFLLSRLIKWQDDDTEFDIQISASTLGGNELFNTFTNTRNLFGSILRPNKLIHPIRFTKNSILKLDIRNLTSNNSSIDLLLDGIKIME